MGWVPIRNLAGGLELEVKLLGPSQPGSCGWDQLTRASVEPGSAKTSMFAGHKIVTTRDSGIDFGKKRGKVRGGRLWEEREKKNQEMRELKNEKSEGARGREKWEDKRGMEEKEEKKASKMH